MGRWVTTPSSTLSSHLYFSTVFPHPATFPTSRAISETPSQSSSARCQLASWCGVWGVDEVWGVELNGSVPAGLLVVVTQVCMIQSSSWSSALR